MGEHPKWLYGKMGRPESEDIMKAHNAKNGDFLIRGRPEQDGDYILVLMFNGKPTHHLLKLDSVTGSWTVNNKQYGKPKSIEELVTQLQKPFPGWPIVLGTGIVHEEKPISSPTAASENNLAAQAETERLQRQEEDKRRKEAEEAQRRGDEERVRQEENARRAAEESQRQAAEAEARRKAAEEDTRRKAAAAEEARKQAQSSANADHDAQVRAQQAVVDGLKGKIREQSAKVKLHEENLAVLKQKLKDCDMEVNKSKKEVADSIAARSGGDDDHDTDDSSNEPAYLHEEVPREDADAMLGDKPDGTFLVRKRPSPDEFVLDLMYKRKPTHHLMKKNDKGHLTINGKLYGEFSELSKLITHLRSQVPGWPIVLGVGIDNPHKKPSQPTSSDLAKEKRMKDANAALEAAVQRSNETKQQIQLEESRLGEVQTEIRRLEGELKSQEEKLKALSSAAPTEPVRLDQIKVDYQQPTPSPTPAPAPVPAPSYSSSFSPLPSSPPQSSKTVEIGSPISLSTSRISQNLDETFWNLEDGDESRDKVNLASLVQSRTASRKNRGSMVSIDGTSTVIITGRVGFADFINGHYDGQIGVLHDGHPVYKHIYTITSGYGKETGRELFLYYHRQNRAWAISQFLGGDGIVAYALDSAARPDQITSGWKVSNPEGLFLEDSSVKCLPSVVALTPFRRMLQSNADVNIFKRSVLDEEVADLCAELTSPASQMKMLKLYHNQLSEASLRALCTALKSNKTLTHLQLRNNKINDYSAKIIGEMLQENTALRNLSLRDNQIGNLGLRYLCEGLAKNRSLLLLSLRDNEISDDGIGYLVTCLRTNKTLMGIAIYDNRIDNVKKCRKSVSAVSKCIFEFESSDAASHA